MDITKFSEDKCEKTEYRYKMLVYPNITLQKDLERDSYVVVLRNVIKYLNQHHNIHFTVLTPYMVNSLAFPNVEQVIYNLPSYPNQMRTHFDSQAFLDIIDWKRNDFDIIYSHLPEHTAQIANVINNTTHMTPNMIGYCHWYEVPENTEYSHTMFLSNIIGTRHMMECGVNSEWLKDLVLDRASRYFSDRVIKLLDSILQPHYLGIDAWYPREHNRIIPKSIMFNHRPSAYTGWDWFVGMMDIMWKHRQDFTVYTTMAEVDRPWSKKMNFSTRDEYINFLSRMQFGVGCFREYSAWSISVTDGFSVGVPYLLPNDFCYPEMVGKQYPHLFTGEVEFVDQIGKMLDSPSTFNVTANLAQSMMWDSRIEKWFGGWNKVFDLQPLKSETDAFKELVNLIRKNGYISKKNLLDKLGWGLHIKWSPYRNLLRSIPEIKFTKEGYEWRTTSV